MFIVANELVVDEMHQAQFESAFAQSMRATLPGVPGLLRASLLAPSEPGRGHVSTLEFESEDAYRAYLESPAFRAAHPWPGRVPLVSSSLSTYSVHTDLTGGELAEAGEQ
ncbi:antibiotic biosynthesis monooxygenase family protein [Arthrobacter rhombi]|uniref:antibiotic biosynthesis monooxygenase family protein n=1 Tax=Arthrobacter rhombi TaxID=71253 RepID=UPI003FD07A7D